ncbi:MAG TPA: hypothetical protein VFW21_15655 [Mycobacterium sp.]|nr:hypothetical protein [Mycobacterium sp.]
MRKRSLSFVRALAVMALIVSMPLANADPGVSPLLGNSPTLGLRDLGVDPDLLFYGQVGTVLLTVPVPDGMTPESLDVTVQMPVNVRSASLTVSQDNRVLRQVDLPPTGGPLVIPLDGVRVDGNSANLMLRSYLLPLEGYCLDPTNPLRLVNSAVTFAGTELAPSTVADFLPPVLRRLVIYVGTKPSQAEADAVVKLATSVEAHYGQQDPDIVVAPLAGGAPPVAPPGDSPPLERHIVVSEGPDAGVSLLPASTGMPALLITGSANDITNQARLITSAIGRYALGSKAVVGPLRNTPQLPGNETTIRELGQPGVNAVALNPQVGINLDQTRLGRSAQNIRVHLIGSYTPLPTTVGGQIVATIGGETIERWAADPSGVIDRWVDIPDRLLQRYTTLAVQVNISGNTGRCGEFQPITLTIDGSTVVQSKAAKPPVPEGFQSLPQTLMPRVQIGVGSDVFADTMRAVSIMTGLQQLSALPIDTSVVPLKEAIDSPNPAILISADGWDNNRLPLPVTAPDTVPTTLSVVDDNGNPTTLTLEPQLKFGSLQTIFDGKRSVLVATSSNGAAGQLDALLGWLAADKHRWSTLNGLGIVSVPGREPVTVPGGATSSAAAVSHESPQWWWWAGGGLAVIVAVGALWLTLRSRRRSGS